MTTFLITLATGNQGSSTVRQLIQAGSAVKAIVNSRKSPRAVALEQLGAKIYEGSLDDGAVLQEAVQGVEGIFLNLVPGGDADPDAEVRGTRNLLKFALDAGAVKTVVISSAMDTGMHNDRLARDPAYPASGYYASKHAAEEAVRSSGISNVVILRPGWLFHNQIAPFSTVHFPELLKDRTLATGLRPETRQAWFNPDDVGRFAAAALLHPEQYAGQSLELGNENLTAADAAKIMSKVSGVEVKVKHRSDEEIKALGKKAPPTLQFQLLANWDPVHIPTGSLDQYDIALVTYEEYLKGNLGPLRKALGLE